MALKSQDVLVLVKWSLHPAKIWTVRALAAEVGLSPPEVVNCTRRLKHSRLLGRLGDEGERLVPLRQNAVEFLVHGVKYFFPAERGGVTRGIPTAYGAPLLRKHFPLARGALVPVWPAPEGKVRGEALEPLYHSVVEAAARDETLYDALALLDAIRAGNARERGLAVELLTKQVLGEGR